MNQGIISLMIYANLDSVLYYDWETKTVLYQYTRFPKNYSSGLTVSNLLGIRSGHKECEPKEEHDTHAYYFYRKSFFEGKPIN